MDVTTFISTVRWVYAATMPDWPHEYTIRAWRPDGHEGFTQLCQLIQDIGTIEAWPPAPAEPIYHHRYLVIGKHKYWAMGPRGDRDSVAQMIVINRADV